MASAAYDHVMNGEDEQDEKMEEDEDEETQEASAHRRARIMSVCDSLLGERAHARKRC